MGSQCFEWQMQAYSFLVKIVVFLHFIGRIYLSKMILHHVIGII